MRFGDTGAFSASASSCAFWLTLALRPGVRIVLRASLRLFCLPCRVKGPCAEPFAYPFFCSFRACHLSKGITPFCCGGQAGLPARDELRPKCSSSWVGRRSGWKGGNLKVSRGSDSLWDAEAMNRWWEEEGPLKLSVSYAMGRD